jgi:pyruvate,water dikinase
VYVASFQKARAEHQSYGGKAARLIGMHQAGFPVPSGFCVSIDGYSSVAAAAGLDGMVFGDGSAACLKDPAQARALSCQVLSSLEGTELPERLEAELRHAHGDLARKRPGRGVAVRSSAVCEDGRAASFAGMYESFLDVRSPLAVIDAVLGCYASLWRPHAIQYRAVAGIDQTSERMAVVVMEMVPARVAGVAFSANPISGSLDEVVINASWGLGESVVSGRVTPDHVVARKAGGETTAYIVGGKELEICPDEGGGTATREVEHERASSRCLSEADVRELTQLVREVEQFYGEPQDIEFAIADEGLKILQARPVTGLRRAAAAAERQPAVSGAASR